MSAHYRQSGASLVEMLVVAAIVAAVLAAGVPRLERWSAGTRLRLAAGELVGTLRRARALAIARGEKVGLKFRPRGDGSASFTLYRDGDGDGLSTRDIEAGVDPPLAPPRELAHLGDACGFGIPPGARPRDPGDPGRRLARRDDPIRFNRSDLASFGPLGGGTAGSLYLTCGGRLAVVRVFGRTGKVRVLRYDFHRDHWY